MSEVDTQVKPVDQASGAAESAAMTTTTAANGATATTNGAAESVVPSSESNESSDVKETPAQPPKPVSAPPKVNPWKVRAEQAPSPASARPQNGGEADQTTVSQAPSTASPTTTPANGSSQATAAPRKTHRPTRSTAPAIDDATLWPTLDKALEDRSENLSRKTTNGEGGETIAPSAPKVTGKEKWTKYTPTITYTPLPSKAARGGAAGAKLGGRGGAAPRTGGREKSTTAETLENGGEGGVKSSRSSDTSRSRVPKSRSLSVSNTRSERPNLHDPQGARESEIPAASQQRSQSSKRSDRGSVSAPSGNTPVSDSSKSPQVGAINGPSTEFAIPANELRAQRSSYDSAFAAPRGRGGYRGTRGNHQGNFNGRYQAHTFGQPHFQAPRGYGGREQMPYGYDQYQNFVNPSLAPVMIDPLVARQMVLNQCEYYFSIENLCKDMFLRRHMDEDGFVNLPILAKFNRVRAITMDYALIRDVCVMSSVIELRASPGAYDKIRRSEGWEQWVLPEDQRDASTKEVPEPVPEIPVGAQSGANDEKKAVMGSNIGAPAFVPGQTASDAAAVNTNTLNENFANLGMGRKLSPDVKEFKTSRERMQDESTAPTDAA